MRGIGFPGRVRAKRLLDWNWNWNWIPELWRKIWVHWIKKHCDGEFWFNLFLTDEAARICTLLPFKILQNEWGDPRKCARNQQVVHFYSRNRVISKCDFACIILFYKLISSESSRTGPSPVRNMPTLPSLILSPFVKRKTKVCTRRIDRLLYCVVVHGYKLVEWFNPITNENEHYFFRLRLPLFWSLIIPPVVLLFTWLQYAWQKRFVNDNLVVGGGWWCMVISWWSGSIR